MEVLASPEAQEISAEANDEDSAGPGTQPSERVASQGELTPDDVSLEHLGALRRTEGAGLDG